MLSTEQVGTSANTFDFRLEVLGSNVGQDTQYPNLGDSWLSSDFPGQYFISGHGRILLQIF